MKNLILLACIVFFIVGCSDKVWIEQEVKYDSRINCTYKIYTYLWYGNFFSFYRNQIERSTVYFNISGKSLEELKADEMEKMIPYKEKLIEALKTDC